MTPLPYPMIEIEMTEKVSGQTKRPTYGLTLRQNGVVPPNTSYRSTSHSASSAFCGQGTHYAPFLQYSTNPNLATFHLQVSRQQ